MSILRNKRLSSISSVISALSLSSGAESDVSPPNFCDFSDIIIEEMVYCTKRSPSLTRQLDRAADEGPIYKTGNTMVKKHGYITHKKKAHVYGNSIDYRCGFRCCTAMLTSSWWYVAIRTMISCWSLANGDALTIGWGTGNKGTLTA